MTPAERRRWKELNGIANNERWPGSEEFCRDLEARGLARQYDCMFSNDYYSLTPQGEAVFYGEDELVDQSVDPETPSA